MTFPFPDIRAPRTFRRSLLALALLAATTAFAADERLPAPGGAIEPA